MLIDSPNGLNLSDTLATLGCTHRKGRDDQRQDIYRVDGSLVGSFDAREGWEALRDTPEIFQVKE